MKVLNNNHHETGKEFGDWIRLVVLGPQSAACLLEGVKEAESVAALLVVLPI